MEEKTITIENQHFELPEIFTVIATQNPQVQIGTFNLPESQLDRFSMKIKMGYPDKEKTIELLKEHHAEENLSNAPALISLSEILLLRKEIKAIHLSDEVYELIYKLLSLSRNQGDMVPLSNRAGIDLVNLAKACAFMQKRDYVLPDDIFFIFPYCVGHRLTHPDNANIDYEHKLAKKLLEQI